MSCPFTLYVLLIRAKLKPTYIFISSRIHRQFFLYLNLVMCVFFVYVCRATWFCFVISWYPQSRERFKFGNYLQIKKKRIWYVLRRRYWSNSKENIQWNENTWAVIILLHCSIVLHFHSFTTSSYQRPLIFARSSWVCVNGIFNFTCVLHVFLIWDCGCLLDWI